MIKGLRFIAWIMLNKLAAKILFVIFLSEIGEPWAGHPIMTVVFTVVSILGCIFLGIYILDGFKKFADMMNTYWYWGIFIILFPYFCWAIHNDWTNWASIKYVAIDMLFLVTSSFIFQQHFGIWLTQAQKDAIKAFSVFRKMVGV